MSWLANGWQNSARLAHNSHMLVLRGLILGTVALALMAACGGGSGGGDEVKALQAAMAHLGDDPNNPPEIGQEFDCVISIGHQPASPQPTLSDVPGRCLWNVEAQGSSWIVSFRETWFCDDFSAQAPGYPECASARGQHNWQFLVDLGAGSIDTLSESGQFAPDM